jgi:hypothetical protein
MGVRLTAAVSPGDTRRSMPDPEQRGARPDFADRRGMIGPYGVRYSWAYWVVILAALALLVVDIFDDAALWNYLVIGLVAIAIVTRPGGIRGPRHAARAEEQRRPQV